MSLQHQSSMNSAVTSDFAILQHKVLRNTYLLLGMTLVFSGAVAVTSMAMGWKHPGMLITLGVYFGLLFLTTKLRNSPWGLLSVFAFTGFLGYTIGPIIGHYMQTAGGAQTVSMALGGTGVVFITLSAIALFGRTDFSFMGKTLMVGIIIGFLAGLGAYFFEMPALALAVSAMFVLLMSGLILWQTSQIINGGETNYIMATITLFVAIFNMFTSLLHLLGFMSDD